MATRRSSVATLLIFASILCLNSPARVLAEVYRWKDAHGTMHYSDTPPQRSAKETPESAQAGQAVVDAALKDLTSGNVERLVSAYRMFEESWTRAYVTETRRLLKLYFTLMRESLGRPTSFEASEASSPAVLDPVPERLWNASDCVFTDYAFRATFAGGGEQRPGDVFIQVCYSTGARKAWLRSVTMVIGPVLQVTLGGLSSPPMDPVFEKAMARFFAEMMSSCERKVLDPDSCGLGELKP